MIIRLFAILLALNFVAFVVRAEAAEPMLLDRMMAERDDMMSVDEIYQLQEWMSGDYQEDHADAVAAIGSRLLSLGFRDDQGAQKSYASDRAQADHGIALLNEGACLNLRWKF
ncbi:hypothetical protein [Marinobacter halophilus]|uniref:Uncharacterized protein n=1 Tax=Marinobacter halophilus TaxID=1323740 RepID=A0A2T1KBI9_9GAMM|nr:hypothetical protein [Marinobacter halophilus]PSF07398.1 hypothetical protein C7H08_13135 [Marinobacter halophilus]GGC81314.1 hypothetical protein GCM10011362_32400 [Marinobacter halophilus]